MKVFTTTSVAYAVLLSLSGIAQCHPTSNSVVHEKRDKAPEHWTKVSAASADTTLDLRIALQESNLHRAEEYLLEVSHPKSDKYGQFWTPQQVIAAFAPTEQAVSSTIDWLLLMGVSKTRIAPSPGRNWIKVKSTVGEAERLLSTKYSVYENDEGIAMVACESYSVPAEIQQHIDFVSPTIQFDTRAGTVNRRVEKRDSIQPKVKSAILSEDPDSLANCSQVTTPACLRAL
jgi:tripeptidyl-peptidase-1